MYSVYAYVTYVYIYCIYKHTSYTEYTPYNFLYIFVTICFFLSICIFTYKIHVYISYIHISGRETSAALCLTKKYLEKKTIAAQRIFKVFSI